MRGIIVYYRDYISISTSAAMVNSHFPSTVNIHLATINFDLPFSSWKKVTKGVG